MMANPVKRSRQLNLYHLLQRKESHLKIVVFGLSVTSSWGNGHATTFRALLAALHRRKHRIIFFEKDEEWYASNRDLPSPEFCDVHLFEHWQTALPSVRRELADCDVALLGSFFPEGVRAAQEVINATKPLKAFYDIDTPITLDKLRNGGAEYLNPQQIPGFDLYLSFTAGPILEQLQREFGARCALPLYCSFEPENYYPRRVFRRYECDLSYMGTYTADRQEKLDELLTRPAQELPQHGFILAGPQYPSKLRWPKNIRRIRHLSPRWHPHFYSSSRLTLNLTRKRMVQWGFSPSVRLFEAAGCGCPIISDSWPGLDRIFNIGEEVLLAEHAQDVIQVVKDGDHSQLRRMGARARERVLDEHSSARRAEQFENYVSAAASNKLSVPSPILAATHEQSRSAQPTGVQP
jgi:spore maturation protein CgeB